MKRRLCRCRDLIEGDGGNPVVKMNVRARLTSSSMSDALPATYAPKLPSALLSVPISTSTRPRRSSSSTSPDPLAPSKPVACASSTITAAPWRSARSQISTSGARSPSMLKIESVTTSTRRAREAASSRSKASRSLCG